MFVDYHLQPLAKRVKSFVKDTNNFLRKLDGLKDLPGNALLCTVDVVGLYQNIPQNEGLLAVKEALKNQVDQTVSIESLMELVEIVLKYKIFEHDDKFISKNKGLQ